MLHVCAVTCQMEMYSQKRLGVKIIYIDIHMNIFAHETIKALMKVRQPEHGPTATCPVEMYMERGLVSR